MKKTTPKPLGPTLAMLHEAVERSGLTQVEIARRAKMHAQDVHRALRNSANPTARTIDAIILACKEPKGKP